MNVPSNQINVPFPFHQINAFPLDNLAMMNLLCRNLARFSGRFRLEQYSNNDYATMCGLLRQKYQLHNEQIKSSGVVKLLDDAGKVVGVYSASEARKKAVGLGLDMVLVNHKSMPMVCKLTAFRSNTIHRFFQEFVSKSSKEFEAKASSVKSIKVSPNLNRNEHTVKIKQILELSEKFSKVRIFMPVKSTHREESLSRLEQVKSELMNKCYIDAQISNRRFQEAEEEEGQNHRRTETFSFIIRAKESDLKKRVGEIKAQDPDTATASFLRKYYSQEDGEMMDLKSGGHFQVDMGEEVEAPADAVEEEEEDEELSLTEVQNEFEREANARILNQRLKVLLSLAK